MEKLVIFFNDIFMPMTFILYRIILHCALGKSKVNVERPVISYITTGRLYIGIYRAEILTTQLVEGNVSQQLQKVGLGEF